MLNREEIRMKMNKRYTEQLGHLLFYSNTNCENSTGWGTFSVTQYFKP